VYPEQHPLEKCAWRSFTASSSPQNKRFSLQMSPLRINVERHVSVGPCLCPWRRHATAPPHSGTPERSPTAGARTLAPKQGEATQMLRYRVAVWLIGAPRRVVQRHSQAQAVALVCAGCGQPEGGEDQTRRERGVPLEVTTCHNLAQLTLDP
jgi:hypothetical protein